MDERIDGDDDDADDGGGAGASDDAIVCGDGSREPRVRGIKRPCCLVFLSNKPPTEQSAFVQQQKKRSASHGKRQKTGRNTIVV